MASVGILLRYQQISTWIRHKLENLEYLTYLNKNIYNMKWLIMETVALYINTKERMRTY